MSILNTVNTLPDSAGILPYIQTYTHDPKNGSWGDCYRTCLACLLKLKPSDIPNFADPEIYQQWATGTFGGAIDEWLDARGLHRVTIRLPVPRDKSPEIFTDLFGSSRSGMGGYWLLVGRSPRATNHIAIYRGSKMVHDPAQDGGGIVGPARVGEDDWSYYGEIITPFGRRETNGRQTTKIRGHCSRRYGARHLRSRGDE